MARKRTKKDIAYTEEYQKKYVRDVVIHISRKTESDILDVIEALPPRKMSAYIKGLIRDDIKRFEESSKT